MTGIVGTILSTIALPLNVIGLAIPYWQYYGTTLGQIHWGLWQICTGLTFGLSGSSGSRSACETIEKEFCFQIEDHRIHLIFASVFAILFLQLSVLASLPDLSEAKEYLKSSSETSSSGLVLRYLVCVAFAARYTKVTLGCMNTNQSIVAQPNTHTVENHITAEQTTSDTDSVVMSVPESLKTVRALELLGMILMCAAIVCAAIKLCVRKDKLVFFQAAGGLAILAGIVMLFGTIVYGVKTKNELNFFRSSFTVSVFDLHAGFGLCITAGCLAIIAGTLFLCEISQPGMVITTTQPGPVLYQVPYASANYNVGSQGAIISVAQPAPYPDTGYSDTAGYAKTSTPY